jgi:cellulose synthase/poly-beta-1,6-N-acetylglucosamine synthase-like glycosyltransferase
MDVREGAALLAPADNAVSLDAHDHSATRAATETRRSSRRVGCPELEPVRHRISLALLAHAEWRGAALGVGCDRVLVAGETLSEDDYLSAFAAATGIPFEPLEQVPRSACPIGDDRLLDAAAKGILPLIAADTTTYVVAPRGGAARRLAQLVAAHPQTRRRLRVTSTQRLHQFILRHGGNALGVQAADALRSAAPFASAAPIARTGTGGRWRLPGLLAALAAAACAAAPDQVLAATSVGFSLLFLGWAILRSLGLFVSLPRRAPRPSIADADLPVYTVIVAVYREAASVAGLVSAIRRLDWPPEKLDVKIVIEPDDRETRGALARLPLPPWFEIIVAPTAGPRTKPKALNAALPFARGSFTVIYDAEDRPERDQLRAALDAFLAHDRDLACVQAALTIDNTADGWLARSFTAEYAAHFDLFLPSLAALRLPLPLGGSSNHFRTEALRAVGAWDPYNVTEDADLGMRLARHGYRATVIESSTYEEAPADLGRWLPQRTRWFKGWIQTWLVHMRAPLALMRDLGLSGFITFNLIVGGSVVTALIYPIFVALAAVRLIAGVPIVDSHTAGLHLLALFGGFLASALNWWAGLARRRLLSNAWIIALLPFYWMLLSLAAWRAVRQFMRDPYRWEKTEHGLAKSSRRARQQPS